MSTQFDQFKSFLLQLVDDPDVRRKNYILQDESYRANIKSRIEGLSADVALTLNWSNALTPSLGMLSKDSHSRSIRFNPKGFSNYLSAFREGTTAQPVRFWRLPDDDPHGARYILVDRGTGLFLLNSSLEVLFRFPGYGPIATGVEYNDPSAVCTFTVGTTQYLAVALFSHHIVQVYQYTSPYTHIATIGILDTPGDTPNYCFNPQGVAVDPATSRLFIANENGTPAGATLDRGYISTYDMVSPSLPLFVETRFYYSTTGRLLDQQVTYPADIFFDSATNYLWVSNGGTTNEVGAFNMGVPAPTLIRYLAPAGSGYVFYSPKQLFVDHQLGGYTKIYVANSASGTIEEFDHVTLAHLNTYGYRASEDELNGLSRLSPAVYGALGEAIGVVSDRIFLDGQYVDVLLVSDVLNKRVQRLNLNAYSQDNFVNFEVLTLPVPISISGWTLSGTIPLELVRVEYRTSETEPFKLLSQETSLPAASTLQFRVGVTLDPNRFVKEWTITQLKVYGIQV